MQFTQHTLFYFNYLDLMVGAIVGWGLRDLVSMTGKGI